jgi:hypothetical protein
VYLRFRFEKKQETPMPSSNAWRHHASLAIALNNRVYLACAQQMPVALGSAAQKLLGNLLGLA